MSLEIGYVQARPHVETRFRGGVFGKHEIVSRRIGGTFETPSGVIEFDKYLISNKTMKQREDLVVLRTRAVPDITETLARLNRAAQVGDRAIRICRAHFGAERTAPKSSCETSNDHYVYAADLPVTVEDIVEIPAYNVDSTGVGLYWLRVGTRYFDYYADNPSRPVGMTSAPVVGVFIPAPTAQGAARRSWQYADALLTPSDVELPGTLTDTSIYTELIALQSNACVTTATTA